MEILQDVLITNSKVLKKTIDAVRKNPVVIILGIIYAVVWSIIVMVASGMGIIGGFIITLASAAMGSHILYVIEIVLSNRTLNLKYWQDGIKAYFLPVLQFSFLYYLVMRGVSLFIIPVFNAMGFGVVVYLVIQFLIFVFFNPLPETIYHSYGHLTDIFNKSFKFVVDNKFAWFIPNLLVAGVFYLINMGLTALFSSFAGSIGFIFSTLILSGFLAFFMIYRGYLYDMLTNTTRRKRLFMRHMN